jgi:hypothetical protein
VKRQNAIRLYRFLFILQAFGLCFGLLKLVSAVRTGVHLYYVGYLVGGIIGCGTAVLWYRQWKAIEAVSEEKWNQVWFIVPSRKD